MIGVCWNVRGMGNPRTFGALKRLIKKFSPYVVFLSKTKLHSSKISKIKDILGFKGGFSVDSNTRSGGLLLLWLEEVDLSVFSFSTGHIDTRIKMNNGFLWRFTGFYGNPNPIRKSSSWDLLRRLKAVDNLPWVCGGDFNDILSVEEKMGGFDKMIS